MNNFDSLAMTAYHEAAHTTMAIAVGQLFDRVTIAPVRATAYSPGSLGSVCIHRIPDPRPQDCWPGSTWVETRIMVDVAGYLMEDHLAETPAWDHHRRGEHPAFGDHAEVVALLATLRMEPRQAAEHVRAVRAKTLSSLLLPSQMRLVDELAQELLKQTTLDARHIRKRWLDGQCGALHPQRPDWRCSNGPHRQGDHTYRAESPGAPISKFPGFPLPMCKERVSELTSVVKAVRSLNRGGPPPKLGRKWDEVFEVFDERVSLPRVNVGPRSR